MDRMSLSLSHYNYFLDGFVVFGPVLNCLMDAVVKVAVAAVVMEVEAAEVIVEGWFFVYFSYIDYGNIATTTTFGIIFLFSNFFFSVFQARNSLV